MRAVVLVAALVLVSQAVAISVQDDAE